MNSERHNNWEIFHVLKHARGGGHMKGKKCTRNKAKRKVMIINQYSAKYQAPTLIRV
jgi:hypothetical protein